jgi:hypothetical protein
MIKIVPTFTITEFAELKGCSRQTIYNNLSCFTLNERGKIIWDKKAEKWKPKSEKVNKRYKNI